MTIEAPVTLLWCLGVPKAKLRLGAVSLPSTYCCCRNTQADVVLFCGTSPSVGPNNGQSPVHGSNRGNSGTVPQGDTTRVAAAQQIDSRVITGPWQSYFFLHHSCSALFLGSGEIGGGGVAPAADRGKDW